MLSQKHIVLIDKLLVLCLETFICQLQVFVLPFEVGYCVVLLGDEVLVLLQRRLVFRGLFGLSILGFIGFNQDIVQVLDGRCQELLSRRLFFLLVRVCRVLPIEVFVEHEHCQLKQTVSLQNLDPWRPRFADAFLVFFSNSMLSVVQTNLEWIGRMHRA